MRINKRILILADPPAAPGYLPRLRYLCDYLVRNGFDIHLATEVYQPLDFAHSYPITTIPIYSGTTWDWGVKSAWSLLTDWHNRIFAKRLLRNIGKETFDVILCTTFSYFPLGAAVDIAEQLSIPLIADIRDLEEQVDDSKYQYRHNAWWAMLFRNIYRSVYRHRRNAAFRKTKHITTISPWHKDFILSLVKDTQTQVHLIWNGFDANQFYPQDIPTKHFDITYIGSLFDWQNTKLIEEAIDEIANPDIRLVMHTPQHQPLKFDQVGDTIRRSSIMIVLTNPATHGMMTTKFYEALGCEKPILCVPSDQGLLADVITSTNAGLASSDREEIKAFILSKYAEWRANGFTHQHVVNKDIFSREKQAIQFKNLIDSLIQQ